MRLFDTAADIFRKHKAFFIVLACAVIAGAVAAVAISGASKKAEPSTPESYKTDTGEFGNGITIHRSEDGVAVIDPAATDYETEPDSDADIMSDNPSGASGGIPVPASVPVSLTAAQNPAVSSMDEVWEKDDTVSFGNFTMAQQTRAVDGSIGRLSIPKIALDVNVYESEDELEAMERGVAHFGHTSSWDGNVGLSAHNLTAGGEAQFFQNLHTLAVGDEVTYQTTLGTRNYTVTDVWEIAESDWSKLDRTDANCLTMITCITSKSSMRLCVRATEKTAQ